MKVRTFLGESGETSRGKCGHFLVKVRTFLGESGETSR